MKHAGSGLPTAAMVTTRPNELMATIHMRRPAILRPEDELKWLDPNVSHAEAQQLLRDPIASEAMEAYAVKPLVNSWENEGPELIEPAGELPEREVQIQLPFI